MGIVISQSGNFNNTEHFLEQAKAQKSRYLLEQYAKEGVEALSLATPIDSSETSHSWGYEVKVVNGSFTIKWTNSKMAGDVPVVILLQYGHGTKNGGYVEGRDFINPALKPIFDKIANETWKGVIGNV